MTRSKTKSQGQNMNEKEVRAAVRAKGLCGKILLSKREQMLSVCILSQGHDSAVHEQLSWKVSTRENETDDDSRRHFTEYIVSNSDIHFVADSATSARWLADLLNTAEQ